MKFWSPLAAFFAAVVRHAPVTAAENVTAPFPKFQELPLDPPADWLYGDKLGDRIVLVVDAPETQYDPMQWRGFVLQHCLGWEVCSVAMAYSVSSNENNRSWMGVLFQGPHAMPSDFYREDGIHYSAVFNRVNETASMA